MDIRGVPHSPLSEVARNVVDDGPDNVLKAFSEKNPEECRLQEVLTDEQLCNLYKETVGENYNESENVADMIPVPPTPFTSARNTLETVLRDVTNMDDQAVSYIESAISRIECLKKNVSTSGD